MANIKIHGQKIQFHKRIAISVSLVQPSPYGTLTYTPAPGQPGLGSLPVGAQIVMVSGDCLIKHNNVVIGELTSSPSSGYELSSYSVWKDSGATYNVTTTPITLDDLDGLTANFIMSTISVTLYVGTGGTASFTPATGTSYTLSTLPVGSKIVKASSTLYNITDSSNTLLGSITVTASSGYDIVGVYISRGGTSIDITTTPVELQNGDTIEPLFDEIPVTLYLSTYSGSKASGGAYWSDGKKEIVALQFVPNRGELQYIGDTYEKLDHIYSFSTSYSYTADTIYLHVDENAYGLSEIDYKDADGYTNTINLKNGNLRIPVDYNGYNVRAGEIMEAIIKGGSSCNVVALSSMTINPNEFTQTIEYALQSQYSYIRQLQQWMSPQGGYMYYTFYDGFLFHMICKASVMFMTPSGMMTNDTVIVAFSTDNKSTSYLTIYDYDGQIRQWYQDMPRWNDTGYPYYGENPWNDVYSNNSQQALGQLMSMWNCQDVCDLTTIIYNLATNK